MIHTLLSAIFIFSQLASAAPFKAPSCAESIVLSAAKKNVKDIYKNRPYGGGVCALGVRQSLQLSRVGGVSGPLGNAIDYINTMPPKGFIDSGLRDPKKAPPGSILVFSGPKSAEYFRTGKLGSPAGDWVGHVTIKGDDGYYYTDGRTAEPANGWTNDRNTAKTRNMAAIFVAGAALVNEFKNKCARLALEEDDMFGRDLALSSLFLASVAAAAVPVETALNAVRSFLELPETAEDRDSKFEEIVKMARDTVPNDVEGQLAQSIAQKIATDGALRRKFSSVIDSMRSGETKIDRCKTLALQATVNENLCLIAAGVKGQDHHREDATALNQCLQGFDFEHCLIGR